MRPKYNRISQLIWSVIICCGCIMMLIMMIIAFAFWYAWFYLAGPVYFVPFLLINLAIDNFFIKIIRWVYKWNKESEGSKAVTLKRK